MGLSGGGGLGCRTGEAVVGWVLGRGWVWAWCLLAVLMCECEWRIIEAWVLLLMNVL